MENQFDPDEFLKNTEAIAAAPQNLSPSGGEVQPAQEIPAWQQVAAPVFQVGKTIADVGGTALGNPLVQHGAELVGGGYAAKRFLVNPILDALKPVAKAVGSKTTEVVDAMNRTATANEMAAKGLAERHAYKVAQQAGQQVGQQAARAASSFAGAPGGYAPTYNVPTGGMPPTTGVPTGPVAPPTAAPTPAPAPAAAATNQPGIIQRGMDIASKMRQIAAERVIPSIGQAARSAINPVTVGIGSMLYSPSTGPDVPQSGPYKGMELNPRTRRPWTPQELAQYR